MGNGLNGKATGQFRVGTPGSCKVTSAKTETGTYTIVEHVDGITKFTGLNQFNQLLESRTIAVCKTDYDLCVILLLHLFELLRIFECNRNRFFHIEGDMCGQNLLNIIQPFGWRRAKHNIVCFWYPGVQLFITDRLAIEFFTIAFQPCSIDIKSSDHFAIQFFYCSAVRTCDVSGTNHQNIHIKPPLNFVGC